MVPVDRHNSPPRTPYQHARRRWLDTVSDLNRRSRLEAGDHARRAWPLLSALLTAACPRKGKGIADGQVESAALALVREHVESCTCRDEDWTWITTQLEERT